MAGRRTLSVRRELHAARDELREAERYILDLERALAELDGAVVMAAVHGWGGGFGNPVCARCIGRGTTWTLNLKTDLPESETCTTCGGDGDPGPCHLCGERHRGLLHCTQPLAFSVPAE